MRPVYNMPRGEDGLFLEPDDPAADMQRLDHNRERAAHHFNYADDTAGDRNSYDEKGDYNCGRCNMAEGTECLLLDIDKIDRKAGSCEDWESIRPEDAELELHRKNPRVANYGVAKNGQGFGCKRCPFGKKAKHPQPDRTLWCGEHAFYADENGCCTANGAATLNIVIRPYSDDDDDGDSPVRPLAGYSGALRRKAGAL